VQHLYAFLYRNIYDVICMIVYIFVDIIKAFSMLCFYEGIFNDLEVHAIGPSSTTLHCQHSRR
jgi:hypothetical protein